MKIAVVGTGYVGLVAGVCFADVGHHVICVDRDEKKIEMLRSGRVPIYEPGLEDLMATARSRIEFITDLSHAVRTSMSYLSPSVRPKPKMVPPIWDQRSRLSMP